MFLFLWSVLLVNLPATYCMGDHDQLYMYVVLNNRATTPYVIINLCSIFFYFSWFLHHILSYFIFFKFMQFFPFLSASFCHFYKFSGFSGNNTFLSVTKNVNLDVHVHRGCNSLIQP